MPSQSRSARQLPRKRGSLPSPSQRKALCHLPRGGGKRTCVSFGKVCGKAKLKKLRLTTKFSFAHGHTLGSPSGRAGETPARAARLRGEPRSETARTQ